MNLKNVPGAVFKKPDMASQEKQCGVKGKMILFISLCLVPVVTPSTAFAGKPDSLFVSDELLVIDLRTDFSAILKKRVKDAEPVEGELRYYYLRQPAVSLPVKISPRGNFRLQPGNCSFPPLLLDFRKEDVKNTLFEKQNKLKLVTPCQEEKEVIEEYTVYKMYNSVTNLSLKTRLALIRYYDTGTDSVMFVKYSFFIEDKDRAAARLESKVTEEYVTPFDIDYDNFKKLSLFQYMIGNKDWHVTIRKNVLIMQPDDKSEKPFAVPYDFDFSGLVNAGYSQLKGVKPDTPQERRLFKGLCYDYEEFREMYDFFRELKPVFRRLIRKAILVPADEKYEIIRFIDEFYPVLKSKYMIREEFLKNCEKREYYFKNTSDSI